MRKRIGKKMLLLLVVSLVFIVYGQNHWSFVDELRYRGYNEVLGSNAGSPEEDTPTIPILVTQDTVDVANAEATSELTDSDGFTFSFFYSYDGDVDTCWRDGASEGGVGEVLVYYFDQPRYIVGMDIINGKADSEEEYYHNNRIKSMIIYYFLDGSVTASVVIDLEDIYNIEPIYYELTDGLFDEAYYCEGVQIVIDSVYAGDEYDDLCLTEMQFYGGIYE